MCKVFTFIDNLTALYAQLSNFYYTRKLFITSHTAISLDNGLNMPFQIKKNQERVFSILNAKKIPFQPVDISQSSHDKDLMRQGAGDPTALPPQIFNGDVYCGVSLIE